MNAATIVKEIRRSSGQSLRDLAERAGTSASTLSFYESGQKEPRLSTLVRIAEAAGIDLEIGLVPRLTTTERRTLALHEGIAAKLRADPNSVIRRARENLRVIRDADRGGHGDIYNDTWASLLDGPIDRLYAVLTGTGQVERDLRQSSPFAGVLTNEERLSILQREHELAH